MIYIVKSDFSKVGDSHPYIHYFYLQLDNVAKRNYLQPNHVAKGKVLTA